MKRAIVIWALCLIAWKVTAQRYSFYNLSVEDGLIQSQVRGLAQDNYGHLWVGTWGGLSRYDGTQFTNYNVRNGMLDNTVLCVATDKQGNIWLGGQEGISLYNGKKFEHFRLVSQESTEPRSIKKICISDDNSAWCNTDNSIYHIAGKQVKKLKLPDSNMIVSALLPVADTLWIATNNGKIFRHFNNSWDSLFYSIPGYTKPPVFTTGIFRTKDNSIIFTTGSGLFMYSNDSVKVVHTKSGLLYNIPFISIAEGNNGTLWLGTGSGAYSLKDSVLKKYNKENGFTDNTITSILADKEGSIWFGSDGQGLYRFSGAQFSILDEKSNLPSEQVMSFTPTGSNNLYIGTADAGLYYYNDGNITPVAMNNRKTYISALLTANHNDIWIGTNRQGLWRIKNGERIFYNTPEMPGNALIISLYKDSYQRVWIGTSRGAVIYNNNRFYTIKDIEDNVFSFAEIGKDSIIAATKKGLLLYHDSIVTRFLTHSSADSSHPQCITMQGNTLWIGTSDNGVISYNIKTGNSFTLNKSNGLQSDFIYNIIADDNGDIWTGTGFGIHKIHMADGSPHVTFYGKEQGITGMESNQNAVCKMPDGTLWFGTTKGAVHIDPDKQLVLPQPVSVILQSVKLFGDDIRDTTYYDSTDNWYNVPYKLRLPYKKNNITFTFKAISLNGNEQLQYRYRIDGLDAPWSDWTHLNSVTYSALPPGKYTLRIESKVQGTDDVKTLAYPFEIITPIHKTSWFSLLILLACILAGISIQYILNRRKQNRLALVDKLRREEQAKVRQRTAEDFHDEVGNRLTRINVLTNVLTAKMGDMSQDKQRLIEQIQENTNQLYSGTKDILWSLQSTNDNLYEILHRIRDFGNDLFSDTEIRFTFSGSDEKWHDYKMPLDMSRNLLMIFKEALNNCLKYADATDVHLDAELKEQNVLHLTLSDNGKGFNVEEVVRGNGLNNMRNRAKRLGGKLYIDSKPGNGTVINLHFRLQKQG
ncbi:MAG: hypothetical protein H6550_14290 [Chitinophagales bacterium]|nr:hypothetical protein [Chitinophagales bacterium]